MQCIAFVSNKGLAGELGAAHFAADAGAAGEGAAVVLGKRLYGTLCGAKNKGPFWPQAGSTHTTKVTAMIR